MNTYRLLLLNVAIATVAAEIDDVPWKRAKCQVSLYDSCSSAPWTTIGLGEYSKSDLEAKGFKDNLLTGIKIEGDESCSVELFDDPNDEGKSRFQQKGFMKKFYKGHSKFSYRKDDGKYVWSDKKMDSIFSDGECHEYGNYGAVTSAAFNEYNGRTSSIRVTWRDAIPANSGPTMWPDVGRAEFKQDFDPNWGESQCICELADDEKNMCTEAFSDREPRCEKYNGLVALSCKSGKQTYSQNETKVRKSQVCGWKERCANFADNPTLSSCIGHDHKFCALRRFLGGSANVTVEDKENPVVWYQTCKADETCCDGQCCDAKEEVCVPMNSKDYGVYKDKNHFGDDYKKIISAVSGAGDKAVFYYDFLLYDLEAVEVNGWKMPNGDEFKNRPMMCQKKILPLDALQHVRVWHRPIWIVFIVLMNLLWTIGALGVKSTLSRIDFFAPIAVCIHCIFLAFSPWGNYALLISLVATATMSWPHDKWNQWLALGQFVAMWHVLGGENLLVDKDPVGFAKPNAYLLSSDHHIKYEEIQNNCQAYYVDYFRDAHNPWTKSYDDHTLYHDIDGEPWGLCSHAWVTITLFMAQNCVFYLAMMFGTSLWKYAYPEPIAPGYLWCCCNKQGDAAVKPTDE